MCTIRNAFKAAIVLAVILFSPLGLGVSSKEQYSDRITVSVSNPAEAAQCYITCELSQKEQAYIAYNYGATCEATADYACALRFYSEAYRIMPTHPQIRAKMKSYRPLQ